VRFLDGFFFIGRIFFWLQVRTELLWMWNGDIGRFLKVKGCRVVFRFRFGLGLIKVRINEDFILFKSLVEVDFGSVLKLGG
jgi:hypothetical protein